MITTNPEPKGLLVALVLLAACAGRADDGCRRSPYELERERFRCTQPGELPDAALRRLGHRRRVRALLPRPRSGLPLGIGWHEQSPPDRIVQLAACFSIGTPLQCGHFSSCGMTIFR